MKKTSPDTLPPGKDFFAAPNPAPRRRNHKPKPNLATWLFIAWLAFMAAWGGKHLYRYWMGIPEPMENSTTFSSGENAAPLSGNK